MGNNYNMGAIMADEKPDLTTPDGVRAYMSAATSEDDWNSRCEEVQGANGGDYPYFWCETILVSGIAQRTQKSWQ